MKWKVFTPQNVFTKCADCNNNCPTVNDFITSIQHFYMFLIMIKNLIETICNRLNIFISFNLKYQTNFFLPYYLSYLKIVASFQQFYFGLLLWRFFCYFSSVILFEILRADYTWFSSIIILLQYSSTYYLLDLKDHVISYLIEKSLRFKFFSQNQVINSPVKSARASTCYLQPWV